MTQPEVVPVLAPTVAVVARAILDDREADALRRFGEATPTERLAEFTGRLVAGSLANPAERTTVEYLTTARDLKAAGVMDHATLTVRVDGVSLGLAKTIAAMASGLAVSIAAGPMSGNEALAFVVPPALVGDVIAEREFTSRMEQAAHAFRSTREALMHRLAWLDDRAARRRLAQDGASGTLPLCLATTMLISGNIRAWRTLIADSGAEGAELEYRRLGVAVFRSLGMESATLFGDFQVRIGPDRGEYLGT